MKNTNNKLNNFGDYLPGRIERVDSVKPIIGCKSTLFSRFRVYRVQLVQKQGGENFAKQHYYCKWGMNNDEVSKNIFY